MKLEGTVPCAPVFDHRPAAPGPSLGGGGVLLLLLLPMLLLLLLLLLIVVFLPLLREVDCTGTPRSDSSAAALDVKGSTAGGDDNDTPSTPAIAAAVAPTSIMSSNICPRSAEYTMEGADDLTGAASVATASATSIVPASMDSSVFI